MDSYKTITGPFEMEMVINKSRFIGRAFPAKDEAEALCLLAQTRKRHWDATHNCYAYVLGKGGQCLKCSDDGEPQGTAGQPILSVLQKTGVTGALVVVTRYFGGVLLGAGGLVRAYSRAAAAALEGAGIVELVLHGVYDIQLSYEMWNRLERPLRQGGYTVAATDYGALVTATVHVVKGGESGLERLVAEQTAGKAALVKTGEEYLRL